MANITALVTLSSLSSTPHPSWPRVAPQTENFVTKVRLSSVELLSYNLKWPLSDARDDQVLLKAYSQATTLKTYTSACTQSIRRYKPELV